MKIVKQTETLPIINFDNNIEICDRKKRHGDLFPNSIRAIIVGPSNCGKTNLLLSLLCAVNGLRFKNIYIYSKSLFQPKYEFLRCVMKRIPTMGYYEFNENGDVVLPENAKEDSIFIFDDISSEKSQTAIQQYYSMGRHKNIDSFYLSQSYAHIGKHLIRDNVNVLFLFRQDETNLKHIYADHVSPDVTFTEFKDMCLKCWTGAYGFLMIDKDSEISSGRRYRKGIDAYIYP